MRISKTNEDEIFNFLGLLNAIEALSKDFYGGSDFSEIDWGDYEEFLELPKDDSEKFLKGLCGMLSKHHFQRILFNCSTLLENCADPDLDYLDFNPDIKAGLEILKNNKV